MGAWGIMALMVVEISEFSGSPERYAFWRPSSPDCLESPEGRLGPDGLEISEFFGSPGRYCCLRLLSRLQRIPGMPLDGSCKYLGSPDSPGRHVPFLLEYLECLLGPLGLQRSLERPAWPCAINMWIGRGNKLHCKEGAPLHKGVPLKGGSFFSHGGPLFVVPQGGSSLSEGGPLL